MSGVVYTYSSPINHAGKYWTHIVSMLFVIVVTDKVDVNW